MIDWSDKWDEREREWDNDSCSTNSHTKYRYWREQKIAYFKNDYDNEQFVSENNAIPIDFLKAMKEIENFPKNEKSVIGFKNRKNGDFVELHHLYKDKWLVDTGVSDYKVFEGQYSSFALATDNEVSTLMKLFFEELPWHDLLNWRSMKFEEMPKMEEIL